MCSMPGRDMWQTLSMDVRLLRCFGGDAVKFQGFLYALCLGGY